MKRNKYLTCLAVLLIAPCIAAADLIEVKLVPDPADIQDLDHNWVYSWGFEVDIPAGERVVGATLTFENIRNHDSSSNWLFIHQLDQCPLGITKVYDAAAGGDFFATFYPQPHSHLVTYQDLPSTPQDLTYDFNGADLVTLNNYLANGRAGLGFDPDCHFYNDGAALNLTISPEPASWLLVAIGALGVIRRRW